MPSFSKTGNDRHNDRSSLLVLVRGGNPKVAHFLSFPHMNDPLLEDVAPPRPALGGGSGSTKHDDWRRSRLGNTPVRYWTQKGFTKYVDRLLFVSLELAEGTLQ